MFYASFEGWSSLFRVLYFSKFWGNQMHGGPRRPLALAPLAGGRWGETAPFTFMPMSPKYSRYRHQTFRTPSSINVAKSFFSDYNRLAANDVRGTSCSTIFDAKIGFAGRSVKPIVSLIGENVWKEKWKKKKEKKKKKKKHFNPYKKDKYTISKLNEYKKYLEYLETVRAQGNLDLEY